MTVYQLIIGSIIVEQLLQGLHNHYLWVEYIVPQIERIQGSWWKVAIRKGLLCKFCQSFSAGWVIALCISIWIGWSLDWVWAGVVIAFGANMTHGIRHLMERIKYDGLPEARRVED